MNKATDNEVIAHGRRGDFSALLGSVTRGVLELGRGISKATIQADLTMPDLYRAHFDGPIPHVQAQDGVVTIRYPDLLPFEWARYALFWGRQQAEIVLNATIPWQIEVRGGIADLDADLRKLHLAALDVSGGASHLTVLLPRPSGVVPVRFDGGASNAMFHRPSDVPMRVRVGHGVSNLTLDDQHFGAIGGETRWERPDYKNATDRYDISIQGGASNLTIDTW